MDNKTAVTAVTNEKRKMNLPHIYALAFIFIVIMGGLTWVIPSGQYDRRDVTVGSSTKSVPVDGTYHSVQKVTKDGDTRQGIFDILMAPTRGVQKSADVVAFVLLLGGAFQILNKTGAITAGMKRAIKKFGNKGAFIIPFSMLLFGVGGTMTGMAEELIPFYLIFMPLMFNLGYDSMTTFLIVFLGSGIGVAAGTVNLLMS
ncbi:hypothetical protein [Petroclostridium sp. X23]|uniref:hypothetical protein n=1 Tax=Petroclostridium sp. X23 TaxID=3045146 RepID=UPI0024AD4F41|nr:hypothetical protein [Petroclostridium sp. X23]WHH58047.1 hypothetical protein QKW49_19895 [Petroclostridium sp. X23]